MSEVGDKELLTKLMIRNWILYLSTVTIYTEVVRTCIFVYDITVTVYICTSTLIDRVLKKMWYVGLNSGLLPGKSTEFTLNRIFSVKVA